MTMQVLASTQASPEVPLNENFESLDWASFGAKRQPATTGLTWGYYGGRWNGFSVADGTVAMANNATNYVVANRATGAISVSSAATNWNDTGTYARLYQITTASGVVTAVQDHRAGLFGVHGMALPQRRQVSVSTAASFALADMNATWLHPSADTTARTWTIPANGSVAFPVDAQLELINQNGAGAITVAITTDTMRLASAGTTGSRTLAANGVAWARKIAATEWLIWGFGLT